MTDVNPQQPAQPNQAQPPQTPAPSGSPQPPAQVPAQPQPASEVQTLKAEVDSLKTQVQQIIPFVQDASVIVNSVLKNPQIKSQVQADIQGQASQVQNPDQTSPPTQQPQPQTQPGQANPVPTQPPAQPTNQPQTPTPQQINARVNSMDLERREQIVSQIENQFGYQNLPDDQKKALRGSVEKQLNTWGTSVMTAPVNTLTKMLKDAYMLSDISKAKEQGRTEALISAHQNEQGALPGMGTQAAQPEETNLMTPHHEQWSKRLEVDADKVAQNLKEFNATGKITYKEPQKQTQPPQPVPSGTPTPPAQPVPTTPSIQPQPQPQPQPQNPPAQKPPQQA